MSLIPPIGTLGIYQLKTPFQNALRSNVSYRCEAIRRYNDFLESGEDPFELYYQPYGLSRAVYEADAQRGEAIVSLVSQADHWVYVPSSYIGSFPNQGGVPYQGLVLGVPLGPVPVNLDLAGIKVAIENIVRDQLGITVSTNFVAVTEVQNLTQEDHERLETARENAIRDVVTDRAKYLQLQSNFQELQLQYASMEEYIRNLPPTP